MVGPTTQPDRQLMRGRLGRAGIALPAAITAIAALSVLIAGVWVMVDLNAKTSLNRRSAMNAMLVAEAGASHALALMRGKLRNVKFDQFLKGADNVGFTTADNGLLINYAGLTSDEQIPAAGRAYGGGMYFVTIVDDPADGNIDPLTDSNDRVLARCRGVMPDGASAEIQAVIGFFPYPALATEGSMKFGGNAKITGACGGLHANELIEVSGMSSTVNGPITASDTVQAGTCQIKKDDGSCNTPLHHQPPVDIPELTTSGMCSASTADTMYVMRTDGYIEQYVNDLLIETRNANGLEPWGWKYTGSGMWTVSAGTVVDGTFCVNGNVSVSGNPGTDADPWSTSIFATGSVQFSGNPKVTANDPSGALIVAEGDVKFTGTASTTENYNGLIYAGSQCTGTGTPRISGQLLCKDNPNPSGSADIVDFGASELTASVGGNIEITFGCGGMLSKRKIMTWMQKLGS